MISELRLRNFKRFGNEFSSIRTAPLTLIFGSNSSGKSSILQALLLMRQMWETENGVAELRPNGHLISLGRFGNILHEHQNVELEIGISWDSKSVDFKWSGTFLPGPRDGANTLPVIGTLNGCRTSDHGALFLGRARRLEGDGNQGIIEIPFLDKSWTDSPYWEASTKAGRDALLHTGRMKVPVLRFDPREQTRSIGLVDTPSLQVVLDDMIQAGQLPTYQDQEEFYEDNRRAQAEWLQAHAAALLPDSDFLRALERRLDASIFGMRRDLSKLRYIGPTRVSGRRVYFRDGLDSDEVGSRGERLGDVLTRFPQRQREIDRMFEYIGVPHRLHCRPVNTLDAPTEILLGPMAAASGSPAAGPLVGIPDVGFGVGQLLPILAEWAAVLDPTTSANTLLVEQPELHLHPDWQIKLLQLFAESLQTASQDNGQANVQVILETHSELIALAAQQLVRSKKIDPGDISLLAVEVVNGKTHVHPIDLDEDGEFMDTWPGDFFPQRDELLYGGKIR